MNPPVINLKTHENLFHEVDYDTSIDRLIYIHVTALEQDPTSIHLEDWDALGLWGVLVPVGMDLAANIALDAFHSTVPIKWMDSVGWTVRDAHTGARLERDEGAEWYTLQQYAKAVHFVGHLG